jgi:uncharacterized protein YdeI (YjbR/CyaY-like superfamily)
MNKMNPKIDQYLSQGCGRCSLTNTPECKVHNWTAELEKLRQIVLDCGLTEELKWGQPVYTFDGNNVILISAFKEFCVISFFKGALLKDLNKILSKQGENVQSARIVKFTDVRKIVELESVLKNYIQEAIEVEKAGLKVELKDVSAYAIPDELQTKFAENESFRNAFYSLTAGRQKGYLLHFSQPKQSKTRTERIEKFMPQIFKGKGLHDR